MFENLDLRNIIWNSLSEVSFMSHDDMNLNNLNMVLSGFTTSILWSYSTYYVKLSTRRQSMMYTMYIIIFNHSRLIEIRTWGTFPESRELE